MTLVGMTLAGMNQPPPSPEGALMSVSQEQIVATVTGIVTEELGLGADSVAPSADLRSLQGADSVKVLRMIARIERHYDVELDDEDVFGLSSINDVALVVTGALALDPA